MTPVCDGSAVQERPGEGGSGGPVVDERRVGPVPADRGRGAQDRQPPRAERVERLPGGQDLEVHRLQIRAVLHGGLEQGGHVGLLRRRQFGEDQGCVAHVPTDGLGERDAGEDHAVLGLEERDAGVLQIDLRLGHVETRPLPDLEESLREVELLLVRVDRLLRHVHERLGGQHDVVGRSNVQLDLLPGVLHVEAGRALHVTRGLVGTEGAAEVPEGLVEGDARAVEWVDGIARLHARVERGAEDAGRGRGRRQEAGPGHADLSLGLHERTLGLGDLGVLLRQDQGLVDGEGGTRRQGERQEGCVHSNLRAVMGSRREALWAG
jgi:hypothetical protein